MKKVIDNFPYLEYYQINIFSGVGFMTKIFLKKHVSFIKEIFTNFSLLMCHSRFVVKSA